MKRYIRSTAVTLLALLAALPAVAARPVQRTIPADADVEIDIEILSGRVEITGWGESSIQIDGTLGSRVADLDVSADGTRSISIETELPRGHHSHGADVGADLRISVPAGARIEVETLSAAVIADGLRGSIEVESMSGSVTLGGDLEMVDVETISGNLRFTGTTPHIEVESVSGDVWIERVDSVVEVTTVDGDIHVVAGTIESGQLESVSGDIDFHGALGVHADLDVAVHSANVTLSLPASTSARFEIGTYSGEIENAFGVAAHRESRWMTTKTLDFTLGDGRASVQIESFSGNVILEKH